MCAMFSQLAPLSATTLVDVRLTPTPFSRATVPTQRTSATRVSLVRSYAAGETVLPLGVRAVLLLIVFVGRIREVY